MNASINHDRKHYERLGEAMDEEMTYVEFPSPLPLADDPNPGARLKRLVYQRQVFERENRRQTGEIIEELRKRGTSWNAIGQLMNVSGEAVRKQYGR